MPVLPGSYTAQLGDAPAFGGRRAEAGDFGPTVTSDVGAKIAHAGNAYLADTEEKEARQALVQSSELRAKYAKALDEASLNGGDLPALKEQMANDYGKIAEGFQTKKGADSVTVYTANASLMFDEQANAITVRRAAAEARLEGHKFLNSASAIIQSNPLYLAEAVRNADDFAATLRNVPPEKRAEIADGLKKELNMAAALGAARIAPVETKAKLDAGEWDLTPEQRNQAINKADTEVRALRADALYKRNEAEYQERERDEAARDKQFKGIISGQTSRRQIMDDPDLKPATREHLITFMEHRAKAFASEEKRSDPAVKRALFLAATAPDGDPRRTYNADGIFEAVAAGKINVTDATFLNNIVAQQKDENGRAIGTKLNSLVGNMNRAFSQDPNYVQQPALVAAIQNHYVDAVYERTAALRKAKGEDPQQVFDPTNKNYVGSPEFIQRSVDAVKAQRNAALPQAPRVNTIAERDALPPDTPYIGPDGNPARTPKTRAAPPASDVDAWRAATGGQIPAGMNEKQAAAAWKQRQDPSWKRSDGSQKGSGFLGELKTPDGHTATEISIGVNIGGKEVEIPTLVPGLTDAEKKLLLRGDKPTDAIVDKAVAHAKARMKAGKSVFAD